MSEDIWKTQKKENVDVLILDGYVDEPSLLGVPPYISPEPRLLAGVAEENGLDWGYITVDEYREIGLPEAKVVLVHGGVTVPGNYLSGTPLSSREAEDVSEVRAETFLGGPLAKYEDIKGYDHYAEKDLSAYFFETLKGNPEDRWISEEERERWLKKGAKVVKRHPMYPDPLLPEISMYQGCPRYFVGGCSFCTEPDYGRPDFREQEDIASEMRAMYELGIRHFRLGGQSCTLSYKADGIGEEETPIPRPVEFESLFEKISSSCPKLKVLHSDNANPAVISEYPDKAKKVLQILVEYTTSGNVLAFGLESADPKVVERNNLNARPSQVKEAVRVMNEVGRKRGENGMPELLPGLNFLGGLFGERPETYEKNLRFLRDIREEGLWLRRINIRQVLSREQEFDMRHKREFKRFKKMVREEIERPLLKEIFPQGTVLRNVYMEKREGKKTFGRQVGTYPLLVGVEYPLEIGKYFDIAVTDYGYRSITGIHHPFRISEAGYEQLKAIPGIGEKRAATIFRKMPSTEKDLKDILEGEEKPLKYVSFENRE